MMKRLLPLFSYLFHPLFTSVYACLFYFVITKDFFYQHEIYLVFIQVLILTVLLPVSLFYLLRSLGLIKSQRHLNKSERRLPLAIYCILLFFLLRHSLSSIVVPELYYFFLGGLISTMLSLMLVLFKYKPSLHMMGIAALTLFSISISAYYHITFLYFIAFLIICTGFTASARLYKGHSSVSEIVSGLLIGIGPQVGLWFLWLVPSV